MTDDASLIAQIARGDIAALGELYDRYVPLVFPVALRILRNHAEAEDALHDAFVIVHDRAAQYTPERGSVPAWLVTVVRNLCIDRARRQQRRGGLAEQYGAEGSKEAPSPEVQVESEAERARVRRALGSLPEEQRRTLLVAFFEGLSYPEIAERDGVPLGTVKSRAARAMAALREELSKK